MIAPRRDAPSRTSTALVVPSHDADPCRVNLSVSDVPDQDDHREPESPGKADPAGSVTPSGVLASRFHQMFPVLSAAEIDRVRRFGEIRRFQAGEFLSRAGEAAPPMYVILSGRVA